jgi:hypothetical protein
MTLSVDSAPCSMWFLTGEVTNRQQAAISTVVKRFATGRRPREVQPAYRLGDPATAAGSRRPRCLTDVQRLDYAPSECGFGNATGGRATLSSSL